MSLPSSNDPSVNALGYTARKKINDTLLRSLVGFYLTLGIAQIGLLIILQEALESLLLTPILFLYVGALVIGKHRDLVVASIMFMSTALIHIALSNLLFFPAEFGMQRALLVLMPSTFLLLPQTEEKWVNGFTIVNILLTILLEGIDPAPFWNITLSPKVSSSIRLITTLTATIATTAIVYQFYLSLRTQQKQLRVEHRRSEELLYNIFPPIIVQRLKLQERTIADNYDDVTVIFADIVGFTQLSENIEPEKLLWILNKFFGEFDQIAHRMGVEKIKTIGDAYMAAAGVPTPTPDHKRQAMRFAAALLMAMERLNVKLDSELSIRIGLHSGPVVAGVIGRQKSIYDLWGDTVNTASRMESTGIPNYIQVSDRIYQELKDEYPFHPRGAQKIKGKRGELHTYIMSLADLRKRLEEDATLQAPEHEKEETVTLHLSDFR